MQLADLGALAPAGMKAAVESALSEILESEQFRRSQRSRLFLQTIVRKAMAGDVDSLKERILGIEIFGRDPMFDTDRDSVVRVAANDVRNRLAEYYKQHPDVRFQITLPAGHYVPTIEVKPEVLAETQADNAPEAPSQHASSGTAPDSRQRKWLGLAAAAVLIVLVVGGVWAFRNKAQTATTPRGAADLPPWSALITANKPINIVLADANLVAATVRLNKSIPIEQYAAHDFKYLPDVPGQFGAYLNQIPLTTVSDAVIAARIADLMARSTAGVQIQNSSRLDISALKGEDPMILVGSPTSNPWVQLFYDQLNFQLVHNFENGSESCINRHPLAGEPAVYTPDRKPAGVSEGYAVVSLVPNLTGKASVVIIAGTSTEATEAAGEFVVNPGELSAALKPVLEHVPHPHHMELLIKASYVSGAAARSEVVAFRVQ